MTRNLATNVDVLVTELGRTIDELNTMTNRSSHYIQERFDKLAAVVAALPLTTERYCFVSNWLADARSQWEVGEFGVARYELEAIRKDIARCLR